MENYFLVTEDKIKKVKFLIYSMLAIITILLFIMFWYKDFFVFNFLQVLAISASLVLFAIIVTLKCIDIVEGKRQQSFLSQPPAVIALTISGIFAGTVLITLLLSRFLVTKNEFSLPEIILFLSALIALMPVMNKIIKIRKEKGRLSAQEADIFDKGIEEIGATIKQVRYSLSSFFMFLAFFIFVLFFGIRLGAYSEIVSGIFMILSPIALLIIVNHFMAKKIQPNEEADTVTAKFLHVLFALMPASLAFVGFLILISAVSNISFGEALKGTFLFALIFYFIYFILIYRMRYLRKIFK